jgi:RNA polymerase sigma-70 factor, ECF subfamily
MVELFLMAMTAYTTPLTPMNPAEDSTLLAAIIQKNEQALATVYDKYAPLCYNIALRIANDRVAAESILQDAFLKVWDKAGNYDGRGSVAGWIVRITRNQALDWLRHERSRTAQIAYSWDDESEDAERDHAGADPQANPEVQMAVKDTTFRLKQALAQLPSEQRFAVELSFLDGLSHHAIAELTGVPLGTIKTRVRLGLQKLRALLNPMEDMPAW